jgi:Ca2+-binding EF-hand superfamily protein
MMQKKMLEK